MVCSIQLPGDLNSFQVFNHIAPGTTLIESSFALPTRQASYLGTLSTKIQLQKLICSALTATGEPVFEMGERIEGLISNAPFAQGAMKCVFQVSHPMGLCLLHL